MEAGKETLTKTSLSRGDFSLVVKDALESERRRKEETFSVGGDFHEQALGCGVTEEIVWAHAEGMLGEAEKPQWVGWLRECTFARYMFPSASGSLNTSFIFLSSLG